MTDETNPAEFKDDAAVTAEPIVIPIVEKVDTYPVKVLVKSPKELATSLYWVGTRDDSPHEMVSVAGIMFQRETDPPREGRDGEQYRERLRGGLARLTAAQVELIKKKVVKKVYQGKFLRNTDDVHFVPTGSEIPLARYLYMVRVQDRMPPNFRDPRSEAPEAMAKES